MPERATDIPLSREPSPDPSLQDRRASSLSDRREQAGGSARRPAKRASVWARYLGIAGRDLVLIIVAVAAIVFAVSRIHPIFANSPPVAEVLTRQAPIAPVAKAVLAPAPKDSTETERLVSSPQFEADRSAFASDLVRTGRMSQARADSIAYYAVREAYVRGIPPAVIFGVMLTENALFVSNAMSNVGAVGLMQVYPKIWLNALSSKFGRDLAADSTNLKYGVYILSQYVKSAEGKVKAQDVTKGLLRYNGCVRGTNTPTCRNYPTKVKNYVERQGESLCGDKSFYECIARPFVAGLLGKTEETQ